MASAVKRCNRCAASKPLDDYARDRSKRDGVRTICRACTNEANRQAYERDPEKKRASTERWEVANRERSLAYRRRHYHENKVRYRAMQARWYRDNHERAIAAIREWQRLNPDAYAASRWRRDQRRRARKRATRFCVITRQALEQRWGYFGGRCWMCNAPASEWDHVKPLSKGGWHVLANLRPACKPCNSAKRDRWPYEMSA